MLPHETSMIPQSKILTRYITVLEGRKWPKSIQKYVNINEVNRFAKVMFHSRLG